MFMIATLVLPTCGKRITKTLIEPQSSLDSMASQPTKKGEEKKEKENTYLSKVKSCWEWICKNQENVVGGAAVVAAIGLIAWITRGEPVYNNNVHQKEKPANPPKEKAKSAPHSTNGSPLQRRRNTSSRKKRTSQETNARGQATIRDYSASDEDDFQATEAEMQSLSREPPILKQAPGVKSPTHKAYGLTEDSEHFISYKFTKTKARKPKTDDVIFLNGKKSKGIYMFNDDGHWYNIVANGDTPKPFKPVAITGIDQ
jgi:hypothetical protein